MKNTISVVIPVYNVAVYLSECLQALCEQTFRDFEVLLIDDGSTDGSSQLCDDFVKQDSRIHVFHQKNSGAASARNAGIIHAKGEYIIFVDADDVPHADYLLKLKKLVEDNDAEIGVCAHQKRYVTHEEIQLNSYTGVFSAQEYLSCFIKDWMSGLIWNKIFKSEVLDNVRFEEGHVIDDEFFTYKAVMNADKVAICNEVLYDYRQRRSGVMSQGRKKKMLMDRLAYYPERFELVTKAYPDLYEQYLSNWADTLIGYKRQAQTDVELLAEAKRLQKAYLFRVLKSEMKLKEKYAYVRAMFEKPVCLDVEESQELEGYFD